MLQGLQRALLVPEQGPTLEMTNDLTSTFCWTCCECNSGLLLLYYYMNMYCWNTVFHTLVGSGPHYPAVWGFWHVGTPGCPPPRTQAPASCKLMVHWALRHRQWSPGHQTKQQRQSKLRRVLQVNQEHRVFLAGHLWDESVFYFSRHILFLQYEEAERTIIRMQEGSVLLLQCKNKPCKPFKTVTSDTIKWTFTIKNKHAKNKVEHYMPN